MFAVNTLKKENSAADHGVSGVIQYLQYARDHHGQGVKNIRKRMGPLRRSILLLRDKPAPPYGTDNSAVFSGVSIVFKTRSACRVYTPCNRKVMSHVTG